MPYEYKREPITQDEANRPRRVIRLSRRVLPPNNTLQRSALRAAAERARSADNECLRNETNERALS